jgi:SAM-dependent methyltransferase
MFSASAEFYDLIYSTFKDYISEATQVAGLLRQLNPHCQTVLDVACGTGEHARLLAGHGFVVDGMDLDAAFVRIAEQKHPAGRFFIADMSDFRLSQRYNAVLCLFGSIGYLQTLDRVRRAFTCFRDHMTADGIIVVEPWFTPGRLDLTRVARQTVEANGIRVSRVSRVEIEGTISRLHFDYEISNPAGTRHASEVHELGLFTTAELLQVFHEAGLQPEHHSKGLTDRGLYIARIP